MTDQPLGPTRLSDGRDPIEDTADDVRLRVFADQYLTVEADNERLRKALEYIAGHAWPNHDHLRLYVRTALDAE